MTCNGIENLSIVVIARNEEFAIIRCLKSLSGMALENCQVICVDSDSNDKTLAVMKSYSAKLPLEIYKISGYVNAAVARNVGIKNIKKKYVFFLDGDIEPNKEFIVKALAIISSGMADMVAGSLTEIVYDRSYKQILKRINDRFNIQHERKVYFSGGCFIARSQFVKQANFMDERLIVNEDIEFTAHLSRYANFLAVPVSMGIHHTQEYHERPLQFLKRSAPLCYSIVIRKNIDRPRVLFALVRKNSGVFFGVIFYFFLILIFILYSCNLTGGKFAIAVILSFLVGDILFGLFRRKKPFNRLLVHYIYPLFFVAGLFKNINTKHSPIITERVL